MLRSIFVTTLTIATAALGTSVVHNFSPEAHTDTTYGQYYAEFQLPLKGEESYLEPGVTFQSNWQISF
jgi:hypothetical protein